MRLRIHLVTSLKIVTQLLTLIYPFILLMKAGEISLIATNLTDEEYITYAGPAPFRPATGDDQLVGLNRGRQVFVEAAFKF